MSPPLTLILFVLALYAAALILSGPGRRPG
jgi:hypothetical protein